MAASATIRRWWLAVWLLAWGGSIVHVRRCLALGWQVFVWTGWKAVNEQLGNVWCSTPDLDTAGMGVIRRAQIRRVFELNTNG